MSDVLNRTTKEQRYSVHTPDYSVVDWIINPDLSGVVGVPKKYWLITGDVVSEMNQAQKDVVDATQLPGIKIAKKEYLRQQGDDLIEDQGYSEGKQRSLIAQHTKSNKGKPKREQYTRDFLNWIEDVDEEVTLKQELVDDQTSEDAVNAISIDSSTLINTDPGVTIAGTLDTTDSSSLDNFLDYNAETTDPLTGIIGPWDQMQILNHRREIYNDSSNPIYVADRTAILGETGYLVDHANRINNLETIHGKLGWHYQQVIQATYTRPKDALFYYGWLNSFNSSVNSWNNESVAQDMAKYSLLVFGDGIQASDHGDYANTQVIIPRVKALNCYSEIYGYVTCDQAFGDFTSKVNEWETLQVDGIFIDEAGYDYGRTRAEFNQRVDYVHSMTYANTCFANAWNTDHILGVTNDPSYPDSTFNDSSAESNLTLNDWILLESFPVNTSSYSSNQGYESASDWAVRGVKAQGLRATYGVNFASVNIINNDNTDSTALSNFSFISSMMFSLEGHGTSDTFYGASSAAVNYYPRPDISQMGVVYNLNCAVQVDVNDSSVYHRYSPNAKMSLDFSVGAHSSTITKF